MNRNTAFLLAVLTSLAFLLNACAPSASTVVPFETLVVQTFEAMTLAVQQLPPTDTPVPSETPTATVTFTPTTEAPEIPDAAGAECAPPDTERAQGRVIRVIDGDTIEVALQDGIQEVSYFGLDAPGVGAQIDWIGPEAFSANRQLVNGQEVVLVKGLLETDLEGAPLRYVFVGQTFVNYELLRQGLARFDPILPEMECYDVFQAAAEEASLAERGVYGPTPFPSDTPTPTTTATPIGGIPTATDTRVPACDCRDPKLSCNSFSTQAKAQACFDYCVDVIGSSFTTLDNNGNGLACEGLD